MVNHSKLLQIMRTTSLYNFIFENLENLRKLLEIITNHIGTCLNKPNTLMKTYANFLYRLLANLYKLFQILTNLYKL